LVGVYVDCGTAEVDGWRGGDEGEAAAEGGLTAGVRRLAEPVVAIERPVACGC